MGVSEQDRRPVVHEPVFRGEPKTVYESMCTCGAKFVGATPYDSREKLDVHLHRVHDKVS